MSFKLFNACRSGLAKVQRTDEDEDLAMRCFSTATIIVLLLSALIVTPRQFLSAPLKCWTEHSESSRVAYIERFCLINGTYRLPPNEFAITYYPKQEELIHWYAMTPLLIILQIFPIAVPLMIWVTFNRHGGIEVAKAVSAAKSIQKKSNYRNTELRVDEVRSIVNNINTVNRQKKRYPKLSRTQNVSAPSRMCCTSSYSSSYLTNLLFTVKLLYLIAIPINFFFIYNFLGHKFLTLGIKVLSVFPSQDAIFFDDIFPLRTHCRVIVKHNNDDVPTQSQCLMSMNIYNEKLFIILWYWYVFLFIYAAVDFAMYTAFRFSSSVRIHLFKHYFPRQGAVFDGKTMRNFFRHYCSMDSCIALRLMDSHLDYNTMTMVCNEFWNLYIAEESKMKGTYGIFLHDDEIDTSEDNVDEYLNVQKEADDFANIPKTMNE